jgi:hypothetical protein
MLNFILGLLVGYYVSSNKETVKKYYNIFINWAKEKINKNQEQ